MRNVVSWKPLVLGASLFLCGASPVMATEVGDLTPDVRGNALQQDGRRVTCVISDKAGPIVGANVLVKGTTIGNISDMDGRVILDGVPDNAILVVSYIGYVTQEISLKNSQNNIKVKLVEDTQALDEVVVVGYGTQAKKDITGSVAVVSTEELKETPVATFSEALQGKASGVYISNSGGPSGETTIRIRGVGSLNGSDPLIVVDGVSNVDIDAVNPNDIESLQVLKDASATAIYGAQGANGVIIITTKQGTKSGRVRVSYDGYFGVAKMANSGYDLLNGWDAKSDEEKMAVADMQSVYSSLSKSLKKEVDSLSKSKTGKDFIDLCKEQAELKTAAQEKAQQEEEQKKSENASKIQEYQASLNSLQQDYDTYAQYAQSLESELADASDEDRSQIQSQIDTNNQMLYSLQQQIAYYQQQIAALQS